MRKTLAIIFVLLTSLASFSFSYQTFNEGVIKLKDTEIKKNNSEIEKRIKSVFDINTYSKEDIKNIVKREFNLWDSDSDEISDLYLDSVIQVFSNTKYEIKEINYLSPESARITLIISIPDINILSSDSVQDKILKKTGEKFKTQTGFSLDEVYESKELLDKYALLFGTIYMEATIEEVRNIKTYNKNEVSYNLEKISGGWNFIDKSVNFFGK